MPISSISLNNQPEGNQLIQQAFESSPNSVFVIDPKEMKMVDANQIALHSLGYSKEELLSKTPQDIDITFNDETIKAAFESIINSKEQHATFPGVYRRKDGSTFEVEAYFKCFTRDNRTYILVSATGTSVLKKAQEELQFHATLFNSIPDAIIATNEQFCITSYNRHAQEMFGWNADEAIGKYTQELMAAVYINPNSSLEEARALLFKNGSWKGEIIVHRKGGATFPAVISIGTVKDNEGNITGTVSVLRDVTEIKQLEKNLKDLNEQLEQRVVQKAEELTNVFDRISDGFTAFDTNWNYTYINKKAAELIHRDPKAIIGKNIWEEFPDTVGTSLYQKYQEAMREQKSVRTEEYVAILQKWFEGLLYPSPQGLSVYFHDITEKKSAERMIIESEEKYRALFEKSPLPNWIYDSETLQFLEVNLAAIAQYGYSKEEFLSMSLYDLKPKERARELVAAHQKGLPETIELDTTHKKKNGEVIKVHFTTHTLQYGNRKARMSIIIDRTEQEKAKEDLIATTQQLRELASHLQDIREEERTNIAREIHDELGQQLTALKMDISWLNKKWNTENESISNKLKGALELIDVTINSVRKIAAQLRPSMLDDLGLAEAITWQSRDFNNRTGIAVDCTIDVPEEKFSPAISIAVFRIYQEALTNIARHANATKIVCSLRKSDKSLCFTITDNGKGFDLNEQRKWSTHGLLGMKERAIMLNGKYNIVSKPGDGTTISVQIPLEY